MPRPPADRPWPARVASGLVAGVLFATALRFGLLGVAGVAMARWGHAPGDLPPAVARCAGAVVLAFVAAFVWRRTRRRPWEIALLLVAPVAALAVVRSRVRLDRRAPEPLDGVYPNAREATWTEGNPRRPRVTYQTNAWGFRGPRFDERPAPGVTRVAVVGDSYVFGSGVEADATLPMALGRALAPTPVEVINLGIEGNNLHSHLRVVRLARERFHARVAVLAVTLPNDLVPCDRQDAVREAARVGPLTLAQAFYGPRVGYFVWESWRLGGRIGAPDVSALARAVTTLDGLVRPGAFDVVVMPFDGGTPSYNEALATARRTRIVVPPPGEVSYFIPDDGHPTALGHRAYAAAIAPAVRASLAAPAP